MKGPKHSKSEEFLAVYYLENQSATVPAARKTASVVPVSAPADDCRDIAELDHFRPKEKAEGHLTEPAHQLQKSGKLIDQGDIEFAMQLMNYCRSPVSKEEKK